MEKEEREKKLGEAKALYLRCRLDEAFSLFEKLARHGSGEAMYFLGEYYTQGYGHIRRDEKKGALWRKRGAAAGSILAMLNTAYDLPADAPARYRLPRELFPDILSLCRAGDIFAQNEIPDLYLYGIGTEKNVEEAIRWLKTAADRGFWRPMNKLGEIYWYGEDVEQDEEEAVRWFRKASAMGYGDAELNLGMCWYSGTKKDYEKAASLFRRAFAHGALFAGDAANMMGLMHLEGNGVAKDRRAAFEWMKRAAEYDSVVGMNHLAVMYESGIGTPADEGKAEYWCRRAADRGHAEAACQYGIYQREKGHAKAAMRYFRQSAEKGNARGQTWLASCYLYGIGTKEDREEARKWLEKAAAQRDEAAIKLLKEDMGIEYKGPFDT